MNNELTDILQILKRMEGRLDSFDTRLSAIERNTLGAPLSPPIELSSAALNLTQPDNPEVILCLDFGTARSKAFATKHNDATLVDLAVGTRAGQTNALHSLLSCVFIDGEGTIFFGEMAAAKSQLAVVRGVRKRIDTFKTMITNATPGSDLRAITLDNHANPSTVPLTEGDILTLYLAYLTDMAALELQQRHGLSRHVRRKFTTPVFKPDHREWAERTLRRHYCEAILIADQFSNQWNTGLAVDKAASALRAAATKYRQVEFLTDDALAEPIAAVASRFRNFQSQKTQRRLVTVVDVGAGTTDFATFVAQEHPNSGMKMFLVPGSVHSLRKAGNEIDRILHEHILQQVRSKHTALNPEVLARIQADLALQQRQIKEDLFRAGSRKYELSDDTVGTVHKDDFLQDEAVKEFGTEVEREFLQSLKGIHPSYFAECAKGELVIIMTGGSAQSLTMIQDLGRVECTIGGNRIRCLRGSDPIPQWVTRDYAELAPEFLQLAVSIGGASRDIPELAPVQYSEFGGLGDNGRWVLPVSYKGV